MGKKKKKKKNSAITLTDTEVVKLFVISQNDNICTNIMTVKKMKWQRCDIVWDLDQTNTFSYIWRTKCIDKDICTALQYFIIIQFSRTCYPCQIPAI